MCENFQGSQHVRFLSLSNSQIQLSLLMPEQDSLFLPDEGDDYLLKHVNAVALMPVPGGRKISLLGRKLFNVLLHKAQEEGDQDEYHARLHEVVDAADYNSKDTAPLKKTLRELLSTTVEWQSPSTGEIETWDACNLLSGAGITKDKKSGAVTIRWRYDSRVRSQLMSPDRYARLSIEAITQLNSHSAMALYEICARYVDNPGHKTARQHWRWWKPVLTGYLGNESKADYRYFKRDVLTKAIAEINERTNLQVAGPIEYKERDNKTIAEIQFEVRLKGRSKERENKIPLTQIAIDDLPVIGRAINAGVKQQEAENLLRKHGPSPVSAAVNDLEQRLQMAAESIGPVMNPGSWLRANVERRAREAAVRNSSKGKKFTSEELKKHRASWTDEWLRRRKDGFRADFQELPSDKQEDILSGFKEELRSSSQPQILKRFEQSGWDHRMVRETFVKYLGVTFLGVDWDKPSAEDILTMAAEIDLARN
jgi:hypothetical protein